LDDFDLRSGIMDVPLRSVFFLPMKRT